jgi:hypothetical protein
MSPLCYSLVFLRSYRLLCLVSFFVHNLNLHDDRHLGGAAPGPIGSLLPIMDCLLELNPFFTHIRYNYHLNLYAFLPSLNPLEQVRLAIFPNKLTAVVIINTLLLLLLLSTIIQIKFYNKFNRNFIFNSWNRFSTGLCLRSCNILDITWHVFFSFFQRLLVDFLAVIFPFECFSMKM